MKKSFAIFLEPKVLAFSAFQIVFYAMMWSSKTVHILFFEKNGAMLNFGISYSAMALVGYFSFAIGYCADVFGFRRVMTLGCAFYALGLLLRIYSGDMTLAVASGLIAGVGASCVLCAARLWMLELSTENTTAQLVGVKSATSSFGTALGCALAGIIPAIYASEGILRSILLGSGFSMLVLTLVMLWQMPETKSVSKESKISSPLNHVKSLFQEYRNLSTITLILGATTGFYVSFITPYLPLIMKDKGLNLLSIGLSTGAFALIRFFIDPVIARFVEDRKASSLQIFLVAEVVIALVTGSLLWSISKWAFVLLMVLRSASLGLSSIAEEVLWLRTFPKEKVGMFFGLSQSGFFLGDFIGGLVNGYLYKSFGLNSCIWIVLVIMLLNAMLFLKLLSKGERAVEAPVLEASC